MSPILPSLRGISNRVSANHSIPSSFPHGNGHSHANRSSVTTSAFITTSSLFSAPNTSPRSVDFVYKISRDADLAGPDSAVEWNVEAVVDWLRTKGLNDMVCDKFMKQDVTGDVLLELDMSSYSHCELLGNK